MTAEERALDYGVPTCAQSMRCCCWLCSFTLLPLIHQSAWERIFTTTTHSLMPPHSTTTNFNTWLVMAFHFWPVFLLSSCVNALKLFSERWIPAKGISLLCMLSNKKKTQQRIPSLCVCAWPVRTSTSKPLSFCWLRLYNVFSVTWVTAFLSCMNKWAQWRIKTVCLWTAVSFKVLTIHSFAQSVERRIYYVGFSNCSILNWRSQRFILFSHGSSWKA